MWLTVAALAPNRKGKQRIERVHANARRGSRWDPRFRAQAHCRIPCHFSIDRDEPSQAPERQRRNACLPASRSEIRMSLMGRSPASRPAGSGRSGASPSAYSIISVQIASVVRAAARRQSRLPRRRSADLCSLWPRCSMAPRLARCATLSDASGCFCHGRRTWTPPRLSGAEARSWVRDVGAQ